jgi:hypothetical protein
MIKTTLAREMHFRASVDGLPREHALHTAADVLEEAYWAFVNLADTDNARGLNSAWAKANRVFVEYQGAH